MAAYIVATVKIDDPAKFGAYIKAIAGLSERFGGEYIVRGKISAVFEGDVDPRELVVVSRFPDAASATAYATSPEYAAGKALRAGAGTVETRLIVDPA